MDTTNTQNPTTPKHTHGALASGAERRACPACEANRAGMCKAERAYRGMSDIGSDLRCTRKATEGAYCTQHARLHREAYSRHVCGVAK